MLLSSWYFRAISYKALSVQAAENALGSALASGCSRGWSEQGSSLPASVLQCLGLCWKRAGLQAESSETENPPAAALSAQGAPRQNSDQGDELFPGMLRAHRSWQGCWKAHGAHPGGWGGLGATPPAKERLLSRRATRRAPSPSTLNPLSPPESIPGSLAELQQPQAGACPGDVSQPLSEPARPREGTARAG